MAMTKIYQSLEEDGIEIELQIEKKEFKGIFHASTLKYLCHDAIYDHRHILDYKEHLPPILGKSVKEFIRTMKSHIHYHQGDSDSESDDSVVSYESYDSNW